ncbi:MAG TPA: pyruvate synthase [Spirochaetota bacterium]|nr:pyruvate synthase [Spirochaetota bacterium]HPJ43948.1 pyruvate synthase [Spirochaetota bacterium]HPR38346.1 pyruvate synthase [Spirochaetota bacterium]
MTKRILITGNAAAAWGARLSSADYIPAFPITPQTEIIETLSEWIHTGEMDARMTVFESEHSMITAAGSAATAGVRVFTATSSQGLMYGMEMIFAIPGWRVPFVLVNVSRGLASPITLECDHNDILAARDSGCIQIHCATCQEVLDSIIMAYKISENREVRLPVMVNLDGFYLSFTREPVEIPDHNVVTNYLGEYNRLNDRYDAATPQARGLIVLGGSMYSYFRYQAHLAALKAIDVYNEAAKEFENQFGRRYNVIETYRTDDAEYCFIMAGSFSTKGKGAVDHLRNEGRKIGLIRPRIIRPFPSGELRLLLSGFKGAAVIDQNISSGKGGILYTEITSALYGAEGDYPVIGSFIGGLGGRDITIEEFTAIADEMKGHAEKGTTPETRLLFNVEELEQIKKVQIIAGTENP